MITSQHQPKPTTSAPPGRNHPTVTPVIAFLGTGRMGGPMAANLARGGFAVRVWNRTISRAEALSANGAVVANSPAQAARGASIVITMLADGPATEQAATGPDGLLRDTGFPWADAENDFQRARRRQALATLAHRLRRQPPGSDQLLRLDEVTGALGWRGERQLGLRTIRLDTIAGTVDSGHDFDRHFRPTSGRVRERWVQLALAQRRGAAIPPIEVYRVGDLHFVSDGHHRVSIAAATGQQAIDAYVTEIFTAVRPAGTMHLGRPGLPIQNPQRTSESCSARSSPGFTITTSAGQKVTGTPRLSITPGADHQGAALRAGQAPPAGAVDRLLQAAALREVPAAEHPVQRGYLAGGRWRRDQVQRRPGCGRPVAGED